MFISKTVLRRLRACAGNSCTAGGGTDINARLRFAFLLAVMLAGSASRNAIATIPLSEIDNAVTDLSAKTTGLSQDVTSLVDKYMMTNAGRCPLLVAGLSSNGMVSISFIPGLSPISGLQADVIVPPGVSVQSMMIGAAGSAAGKSLSVAPIAGGERFLLVGFNQTQINAGEIAMVHLDTTQANIGPHILALSNFIGSDPNGNSVPLCVTTGVITK